MREIQFPVTRTEDGEETLIGEMAELIDWMWEDVQNAILQDYKDALGRVVEMDIVAILAPQRPEIATHGKHFPLSVEGVD